MWIKKDAYSDKQEREAKYMEEGHKRRGMKIEKAELIAWTTMKKLDFREISLKIYEGRGIRGAERDDMKYQAFYQTVVHKRGKK